MYAIREVQRGNYDDRGYSNEETIAHLMLSKPSEINSMLNNHTLASRRTKICVD